MIDEYPILAVAASFAEGTTRMDGWKNCGSRKVTVLRLLRQACRSMVC
jgi:hypothetical protein